jgi:hypothetical protein
MFDPCEMRLDDEHNIREELLYSRKVRCPHDIDRSHLLVWYELYHILVPPFSPSIVFFI